MKKEKHKQKKQPKKSGSDYVFSVKTEENDYKEYAAQYFVKPAQTYLFFLVALLILWIVVNIRTGNDYGNQVWFLLGFLLIAVFVSRSGASLSYRISGMDKITIHYRFGHEAFAAKAGKDEEIHGYDEVKRAIRMQQVLILKMRIGAFVLPYRSMPNQETLLAFLSEKIPENKWRIFERRTRRGKTKSTSK